MVDEELSSDIEEESPSPPPEPRVRNVRPWRAPFAPGSADILEGQCDEV